MNNKDLQNALLNVTHVTYDDGLTNIDNAIVTALVLRKIDDKLSISSVELSEVGNKTIYNVFPKFIK